MDTGRHNSDGSGGGGGDDDDDDDDDDKLYFMRGRLGSVSIENLVSL